MSDASLSSKIRRVLVVDEHEDALKGISAFFERVKRNNFEALSVNAEEREVLLSMKLETRTNPLDWRRTIDMAPPEQPESPPERPLDHIITELMSAKLDKRPFSGVISAYSMPVTAKQNEVLFTPYSRKKDSTERDTATVDVATGEKQPLRLFQEKWAVGASEGGLQLAKIANLLSIPVVLHYW